MIKTASFVNEDVSGSIENLKEEISRLKFILE